MPTFTPTSPTALARLVANRLVELPGRRVLAVDGADGAAPVELGRRIVETLTGRGRSAAVVSVHDYVRPASLRMEYGRDDEWSYRTAWFDYEAMRREIVHALRAEGRWLPALWDEERDRSARAAIRTAQADLVLVLAGPMLLGRGLDFDLAIRLELSEQAALRRTPAHQHWTLPAVRDHTADNPEEATWTVRWDHPERAALRS
ncbi:hypothetical protein [Nocardia alba]|uniref:Uridine kinase n=1 Tax=Nocardia alba TaxID=225051 RepID=A0A4R1FJW7_9NOCA|nr:hypothetical protein [Nocardia alba]TCJ95047.1 hypothetical protein DFR71_3961 [Nocardia alba]